MLHGRTFWIYCFCINNHYLQINFCCSDSAVGIIFSSTDTVCTLQVGWICNYSLCFNWRPAALSVGCSMILYLHVGSSSR
jgi:hypothetical protein